MGDRTGLSHWEKPLFNNAQGFSGPNWVIPPIRFLGVTMRVFPLRADIRTLQRLIDGYLNSTFRIERGGWFRVFLPYVYMMVIDYGRMSAQASNLGWVSQHELAFSIPLEWYRPEGHRLVFHDWAWASPIIFVDEVQSMSTGREVYGWPKSLVKMGLQESNWIKDPLARTPIISVSTQVVDKEYAGQRYQDRVFLEVESHSRETQLRMDTQSLLLPWLGIPNAIQNLIGLLGDSASFLRRQFFGAGAPASRPELYPGFYGRMWSSLTDGGASFRPNIFFNTVNLKQFRSVANPQLACYKALVNARMQVERLNRQGLLGDSRILQGDSSGGYLIHLHRYPSLSLAETFGLERSPHQREDAHVWTVQPVMPFWIDVDMLYNRAETIAWNAGPWRGTSESRARRHDLQLQGAPGAPNAPDRRAVGFDYANTLAQQGDDTPMSIRTTDGTVAQQITGPFDFPNTTLRVLPLLAEEGKLVAFCNAYLNAPLRDTGIRFEVWGRYVYLVITSYEEMSSETNNVGLWAQQELRYVVPVKRYVENERGESDLHSVALVPIFCYADNVISANTGAELYGMPMESATITSPRSRWMSEAGPSSGLTQPLLEVRTPVIAALGQNKRMEERILMEVVRGDPVAYNDDFTQRYIIATWGQSLKNEVIRKKQQAVDAPIESRDARALVLEILANQGSINSINFKQFRDADEPERACYQALTESSSTIYRVYDVQEIDTPLNVRVHHYPTHPIVETLGLISKYVETKGTNLVHNLEPIRPFWMKVGLRTRPGRVFCWRAHTQQWVMVQGSQDAYFNRPSSTSGEACFNPDTLRVWQKLQHPISEWKREYRRDHLLEAARARAAVEKIDPQMAIEMALGREWENWGDPRVYQANQRIQSKLLVPLREKLLTDLTTAEAFASMATDDALAGLVAEAQSEAPTEGGRQKLREAWKTFRERQNAHTLEALRQAIYACWRKPDFYVLSVSLSEFRSPPSPEERVEYWDAWKLCPTWYQGPEVTPRQEKEPPLPPAQPQTGETKI